MKKFRAKFIYLGDGKWLENGVVEVGDDGLIHAVRPKNPTEKIDVENDLEDLSLLPGLINLHAHVEYSCLKNKIPRGLAFADWIPEIVKLKNSIPLDEFKRGARDGFRELVQSGVTTVCDNVSMDITQEIAKDFAPLNVINFYEIIEFLPEKFEEAKSAVADRIEKYEMNNNFSYAPHAPYSASANVFGYFCIGGNVRAQLLPSSIHVSESLDEMEFFEKGSGKLQELKEKFGTIPDSWHCPECSPIEYLSQLHLLHFSDSPNPIFIHCTYPRSSDFDVLRDQSGAVVFCPGTHRYFNRGDYPMLEYLKRGINVCVGTDSLASNDSLDLREELKIVAEMFPGLEMIVLIDLVTVKAARGLNQESGRIETFKNADFSVWDLEMPDLEEWLFNAKWVKSFVGGELLEIK